MARRAGKAATRKARQRKSQRPQSAAASAPAPAPTATSTPVQSAADAVAATPTPRPAPARSNLIASSQLTAAERNEYHYVERDLRDIGMLTLVMTVLLLAAWFAFRALGLLG